MKSSGGQAKGVACSKLWALEGWPGLEARHGELWRRFKPARRAASTLQSRDSRTAQAHLGTVRLPRSPLGAPGLAGLRDGWGIRRRPAGLRCDSLCHDQIERRAASRLAVSIHLPARAWPRDNTRLGRQAGLLPGGAPARVHKCAPSAQRARFQVAGPGPSFVEAKKLVNYDLAPGRPSGRVERAQAGGSNWAKCTRPERATSGRRRQLNCQPLASSPSPSGIERQAARTKALARQRELAEASAQNGAPAERPQRQRRHQTAAATIDEKSKIGNGRWRVWPGAGQSHKLFTMSK